MRIGIVETGELDAGLREPHGDYPAMFARLLLPADPGLDFFTVHVVRGEMPASPAAAEGWLVTGSRHGVYDGLPWIEPLKAFLRACLAARVPVVGICFGHQILAEAMGGRAALSSKGWGAGVHEYRAVRRPGWMADMPERFRVGALHQDQIIEKPAGALVLATSPFCAFAGLAYGDPERPDAISIQAHPEFAPGFLAALIAGRAGTSIPAAVAAAARQSLALPVHSAQWSRAIAAFFRGARGGWAGARAGA